MAGIIVSFGEPNRVSGRLDADSHPAAYAARLAVADQSLVNSGREPFFVPSIIGDMGDVPCVPPLPPPAPFLPPFFVLTSSTSTPRCLGVTPGFRPDFSSSKERGLRMMRSPSLMPLRTWTILSLLAPTLMSTSF